VAVSDPVAAGSTIYSYYHGNGCSNSEKTVIFYSVADGEHHFDAEESKNNISSDSLAHTYETLDFQMTDKNSDLEDHFDSCDFI